ncbi:MAG TPA: Uma2 family endonuclease [Chthonomonadaceae bacterium]|nr:Uma2 family endonuclease [Chthonomonadaceae bacterium]
MVAHQKPQRASPQAYLERERAAERKSEYHDGVIVAMAGASPEHNTIVFNLAGALSAQLRGKPCRGFSSDLRVRVPACNAYYYPDVTVVCGEPQYEMLAGLRSLLNPTLLIEVLSETTEKADREGKFDCYWTLESLKTYVLVSQDRPRMEMFTRQADGSWRVEIANELASVIPLEAIGCALRLADVYENIAFEETPQQDNSSPTG